MPESELKPPSIVAAPEERHDPFPLTDFQQAYWVGRRQDVELGGVTTHYYCEIDCHGLDLERLNLAWQRVVTRHDMLRATISPDGQQQVLDTVPPYQFQVADLRTEDTREADRQLRKLRQTMSSQVLRCDRWPLFDIRVSLLSAESFRLHVNFETLVVDARSRNLIFDEWSQFYQDLDLRMPPLQLSFRDFVMAEVALKETALYRQARTYWQSRLPTLPPSPELPLVKSPDVAIGSRTIRLRKQLAPEVWGNLEALALQKGLTPTVCLLTAFADVLRVWSKHPSFTLNLTLFSRIARDPRLRGVVGDYTSSCLLEVAYEPGATFEAHALLVLEQLREDLKHSSVSGVEAIRELVKLRGAGFGAMMPVVFTSLLAADAKYQEIDPTAWLGEMVYAITQTPQVHLDHQVRQQKGKLDLVWDAVEELYPDGMLQDMFDSYVDSLIRLATDEGSWHEVWTERAEKLVPPAHLALCAEANATMEQIPDLLLQTLFEQQAGKQPDQLAVAAPEMCLTYEQLCHRANQVGHRLREVGALPNSLVGVVMEKGWEQVVAVMGILNAGAAYLPLDPSLPPGRLAALLHEGDVDVLLTQPCHDQAVDWPDGIRRICISADGPGGDASPLTPVQHPEDLAYVIYTSGSTGFPKGVMIEHQSAVNTILDMNRRFKVGPADRVLALSSLSFDLSVYDIFGTLAAGGTIVMPEAWGARDPSHWADLLERERVTIWNSVPVLMQLLTEHLEGLAGRLPSSLRLVLLSGDWIPLSLPDEIRALGTDVQVVSLGGATEGSIWSILYPIDAVDPSWSSIPYGRPMVNQSFHVLNEVLVPRPVWAPGELYIGGLGVARGYWRDPDKTQAHFIANPRSGERLYRTGDMGRYLPNGEIEFLGREDSQVKVQGYRVELGEIEAILLAQPGVRASVVTLHAENRAKKRLVAYVVPEAGARISGSDLGSALRKQLPEYMLPAFYVLLDALPLTPNGKVDRHALPEPDRSQELGRASQPAGQDLLVGKLSQLVADVLGLNELTSNTNLLHLGATSVDMIRIANSLERELQFRPKMNDFYRAPSVQGLLDQYERLEGKGETARVEGRAVTLEIPALKVPVLRDPDERSAFKARRPGLREVGASSPLLPLERAGSVADLRPAYVERRSHRRFSPEAIPFAQFSRWLGWLSALELDTELKYRYASAGGLYPVQTYLYVKPKRVESVEAGIYYHDSLGHQLALLTSITNLDPDIYDPFINRPIFDQAAFALFLIADLAAIAPMYGERSVHYATLEAGLMTQLMETAAAASGIGLCQIGDLDFARIRSLFKLSENHMWLHSLLGGSVEGQRAEPWRSVQEPYSQGIWNETDGFEEGEL